MNFGNLVADNVGMVHLLFSILSLITGSMVLLKTKGTISHKRVGYVYAIAMLGVIVTAFMIYRLFGKFGIFHWLALLSLFTLLAGMIPMFLKKPKGYISLHYNFMYWSVFGLYAAFAAETLVRIPDVVIDSEIPNTTFYNMTGIAVGIVMTLGWYFSFKNKKHWDKFDKSIS